VQWDEDFAEKSGERQQTIENKIVAMRRQCRQINILRGKY